MTSSQYSIVFPDADPVSVCVEWGLKRHTSFLVGNTSKKLLRKYFNNNWKSYAIYSHRYNLGNCTIVFGNCLLPDRSQTIPWTFRWSRYPYAQVGLMSWNTSFESSVTSWLQVEGLIRNLKKNASGGHIGCSFQPLTCWVNQTLSC